MATTTTSGFVDKRINGVEVRHAGEDCLIFNVYGDGELKTYIIYVYNYDVTRQVIRHIAAIKNGIRELKMEECENHSAKSRNEGLIKDLHDQIYSTFMYMLEAAKQLDGTANIDDMEGEGKCSRMDNQLLADIKKGKTEYEELTNIVTTVYETTTISIMKVK